MAYTINLTDGTILATIADGTLDTSSCSMALPGKNYAGYGIYLDENFVHLLENSSNTYRAIDIDGSSHFFCNQLRNYKS